MFENEKKTKNDLVGRVKQVIYIMDVNKDLDKKYFSTYTPGLKTYQI